MAHNLNFKNGKASMAYTGTEPWHKLGTRIDHALTAAEAIAAAQLDYDVAKEPLVLVNGDVVPDKFATVRKDTGAVLGVVGNVYKPLQNREAFSFFDAVVGTKAAIYQTVGALGKGQRIWLLAKLPKSIQVVKNDVVEQYLLLTNSHDGSSAVRVMSTPIRVVCQNTLSAALSAWTTTKDKVSLRHTANIGMGIEDARAALNISYSYFSLFEEVSKHLVSKPATSEIVETLLTDLGFTREKSTTSKQTLTARTAIRELFEAGAGNTLPGVKGTAWALWNGVTEYADFHRTVRTTTTSEADARTQSLLFGSSAQLKQKALNSLLAQTR